jgi:CheY-like chemotaxis protein
MPAVELDKPRQEDALPLRKTASGSCRVLLVDDHIDTVESFAFLIKSWGHDVRVAHDGPRALEQARQHRPDVVLLDLAMPGMDGYELARRLREEVGLSEAALIAISGYGQAEYRQRSQKAGMSHHLLKPVDPSFLRDLLAELREKAGAG